MRAALRIRTPGHPERLFELRTAETLIGRSTAAHLRLPDESISREHAVILLDDEVFTIEDLQSTNGILVNAKRVRSAELQHGDEVQIGTTLLVFVTA